MFFRKALFSIVIVLYSVMVTASEPFAPTASEMELLPPFCKAKIGHHDKNDAATNYWKGVFGPENWIHIHHYCFGVNFVNRSYRPGKARVERDADLRNAINNFNYVLGHTQSNFSLRADVMVQKARALHRLGNEAEVAGLYMKAIELKPDYVPAYIALGDYYKDSGDRAKARETYEAGLKKVPDNSLLNRRIRRLSGK